MTRHTRFRSVAVIAISVLVASCAGTGAFVDTPKVSLRDVSVTALDLSGQTFLLGFDVTNPNPFPLPIRMVSYGVELDGYRFVSGETPSAFTVPASSDSAFAISVDVNLLQTAPQLMLIVRDGVRRDIPYSLKGRFEVDIPFTRPVPFSSSGTIRLQAAAF